MKVLEAEKLRDLIAFSEKQAIDIEIHSLEELDSNVKLTAVIRLWREKKK